MSDAFDPHRVHARATPDDATRRQKGPSPVAEKNRIIDAIREINPTAAAEWLAAFPLSELERYHGRLMDLIERVRASAPERSARPAVAGHEYY
ncbi:MAG: hypothetical protein RI967_209 [Planctomycetota bacterium]